MDLFFLWLTFMAVIIFAKIIKKRNRGGGRTSRAPVWRQGMGENPTTDRPFSPTVSGPGIAIDDGMDWLWVLSDHGFKFLSREEIRTWNHEAVQVTNNYGKLEYWDNKIVFRVSDLKTPVIKVSFGRDRAMAELWQARLSTWLNG